MFISVSRAVTKINTARQIGKFEGDITVYADSGRMPFGYFTKKLNQADLEDTRGFFFGPEENVDTYRGIDQRQFSFTFLYDSQYDPAIGTITSIDLSVTET